jgi:predicted phosphodiesterase
VLAFSCLHFPFQHPHALDFLLSIQKRVKCGTVVCLGDLIDNHAVSFHDHDPDGRSPADEMKEVDKILPTWFKAFPNMYLCLGNHDRMADRKSKTVGLPSRVFKPFRDIWNLPKTWKVDFSFEIDGVKYQHGTGFSGDNAHLNAAYVNRQSSVIGHTHTNGAMGYLVNEKDRIYGMNVGCLIDRRQYAFAYERDFKRKPFLGCGVVTDKGRFCQIFPMEL